MADSNTKSELEAILKETEIGAFILKNKGAIQVVLIVLLLGVAAYTGNYFYTDSQNKKYSKIVFDFEKSKFEDLRTDKLKLAEFVTEFESLKSSVGDFQGMLPFAFQLTDYLIEKGELDEAKKVLVWLEGEFSSRNEYSAFLILSRLAVVNEDLKNYDEAISTLEKLTTSSSKILESKTYFDLGRLYLKAGNKEKSKVNFEYVINNFAGDELAKIAKAYLFKHGLKD